MKQTKEGSKFRTFYFGSPEQQTVFSLKPRLADHIEINVLQVEMMESKDSIIYLVEYEEV